MGWRDYIFKSILSAQSLIFILPQSMIRQKMYFLHTIELIRKYGDILNFFFTAVKRGNHRHSYDKICHMCYCDLSRIFKHQFIGSSGEYTMFFPIHMLDVHQIGVQIRKNLFYCSKRGTSHALHCCIDSCFFCRTQKIPGKFRLA